MKKKPNRILQQAFADYQAGRMVQGERLVRQVLARESNNPDALNLLGVIALAMQKYDQAVPTFRRLVKLIPGNENFQFNLGVASLRAGLYEQAVSAFENAIRLKRNYLAAHIELCTAARLHGNLVRAMEAGEAAVRLAPDHPGGHNNLAGACEDLGRKDAALEHFRKAAELEPENPVIQKNLGDALVSTDDRFAAEACYRKALKTRPTYGEAHRRLVRLKTWSDPFAPEFAQLHGLLGRSALPDEDREQIHFALARMYQDCGEYDYAFKQLLSGNTIEHRRCGIKPESVRDEFSKLIESFDAGLMSRLENQGDPDETPVFIVGMPRSGTTLVEQIIASHPQVFGAGELTWFNGVVRRLADMLDSKQAYPQCVDHLNAGVLQEIGGAYRDYLMQLSGHKCERITDKLPENFFHLGLIGLVFPRARIIHCRRNPKDNAVSIYCEIFPGKMRYGYDLFTLGAFYQQYQRLMRHWDAVLPGRICHIDYEQLVSSGEDGIQSVIKAAGLAWDDACLRFYENKRRVTTASDLQVRQSLYTRSIGRWKQYADYLKPFEEGLAWEQD